MNTRERALQAVLMTAVFIFLVAVLVDAPDWIGYLPSCK